ncbi:MAG: hypothetical protein HYZ14_09380 [Bacteroidetes bacterium]|nr:hypothetical protein [Bacteroidota bacterium]
MRADLHTMEQVDLYLQGKMTGEQLRQFENTLAANPELQSLVTDQQLLIQTVNRKALMAEIHAVAGIGGAPWYANPFVAVTGAALVIGGVSTLIYFMSADAENETSVLANEQTTPVDSPALTGNQTSSDNTYYAYQDSAAGTEDQAEPAFSHQSANTNPVTDHVSANSNIQTDNNPADRLVVQANDATDQASDVVDTKDTENRVSKNRIASYPKGDLALKEFIKDNMRFPGTAREKKISGNVKVKFLVTPEGTRTSIEASCFNMRDENDKPLSSAQVVLNQKIANLFEREAERIVRIMPIWIPATDSQGNAVLAPVELYFNFSLKDGNSVYRLD